jgi:hypothetical protein
VYLNQIITKCGCVVGILALCLVAPRFRSQCGDGLSCQLFVQFSSVAPSSCWIVEGVCFTATPGTSAVSHRKPTHTSTSYDSSTVPVTRPCHFLPYHILPEAYWLFLQLFNAIQSELLKASNWNGLVMHSGLYTCGQCALMTSNVHCLVTRYAVSSVSSTFPHFFIGNFRAEFWNMWSVPLNITCSSLHPRVATRVPTEQC